MEHRRLPLPPPGVTVWDREMIGYTPWSYDAWQRPEPPGLVADIKRISRPREVAPLSAALERYRERDAAQRRLRRIIALNHRMDSSIFRGLMMTGKDMP